MYESKLPLPPDACNEDRLNTAAPATIEALDAEAARRGLSRSATIEALVKDAK